MIEPFDKAEEEQPEQPQDLAVLRLTKISADDAADESPLVAGAGYLESILERMMLRLEPEQLMNLAQCMVSTGKPVLGSMCSGTDCPIIARNTLVKVLRRLTKVSVPEPFHEFSVESEAANPSFIQHTHPNCKHIFPDVTLMGDTVGRDIRTGKLEPIDKVTELIAGFVCKDASRLNVNAGKIRESSVWEGCGKTGETFHAIAKYFKSHGQQLRFGLSENVLGIESSTN